MANKVSITTNREPTSDDELANKQYVDNKIGDNNVLRFNQTLENYLKVSVANDTYNLTKDDKIHLMDTTTIQAPNTDGYLLPNWIN